MNESADSPKRDRDGRVYAGEPLGPTEESFRLIVETIPGLIAVITPTGEVEHVNGQVLEYFGRTLEPVTIAVSPS